MKWPSVMQKSAVNGSHATDVLVTGADVEVGRIGVEVDVGSGAKTVGVIVGKACIDVGMGSRVAGAVEGRLWRGGTGVQDIRMNKRMRRLLRRGASSDRYRRRPTRPAGATPRNDILDPSALLHGLADVFFEIVRFFFKLLQLIQQLLPHRFILQRIEVDLDVIARGRQRGPGQ